ncbi:hypothetical protein HDV05_005813 [Chytridiales sp. JEL 0842]|nr:hypothetical protein HDV05_005813 [Chytridiales sp. JEL 0842]
MNGEPDTDPRDVLPSLFKHLDPSADIQVVKEIESVMATTHQLRQKQTMDSIDVLKKVSRDLEAAKRQLQSSNRTAEEESHRTRMATLDTQKFQTAKGIQDEEKTIESLEVRYRELMGELEEVKRLEKEEEERGAEESV